jgi:aspartyl-tRNA(Asn)/glutamyl-tRNA(Gln) amidotransferase subunit A
MPLPPEETQDLCYSSATTLLKMLHQKTISSYELTSYFLKRIHRYNPLINSLVQIHEEEALQAARAADQCRHKGSHSPLLGLPIAHKDIFCTKNHISSCASRMLSQFTAPYNATIVQQLQNAGTILLGKTNMDEFAMGSSNENSFYGPVKNPWDYDCTPGGSSGGSAAAVAAGFIPMATGTDTGGSIRQPASFCNLVGLKPTYGRVSRYGMIAFASSLDQAGPLTRTVEDAALFLHYMAGSDQRDATSSTRPVPAYHRELQATVKGLRIGLPRAFFNSDLPAETGRCLDKARSFFEEQGAIFVDIELPHILYSIPTYYVLASAECASNLARYDGIRYGYHSPTAQDLSALYCQARTEGFGAEVKRRILIGTYVLSAGHYEAYYGKAQKTRTLIADNFHTAFEKVDLIFSPTTANTAFPLGAKTDDPLSMYNQDVYTTGVSLAGLPALSLPCGFIKEKPIGLQLIAPAFQEQRLLNAGHLYQQHSDWHNRRPLLDKHH